MIAQLSPELTELLNKAGGPWLVICGMLLGLIWMQLNARINSLEKKIEECEKDRHDLRQNSFAQLTAMFDQMLQYMKDTHRNE